MKFLVATLIILFILSACAPVELTPTRTAPAFTTSTSRPRPTASQTALPATPTTAVSPTPSTTVTQTQTPSPTPQPTERRGNTIQLFCLSVTQSIEGSPVQPQEPLSETIGRVLAGAGLTFMPDSDACDAVLSFDFNYIPKSYQYQVESSNQTVSCYTGAGLVGTADLTWQGSSLYHRELRAEYVPVGSPNVCLQQPENAPFGQVWPAAAMTALTEIWGKNVLVPALMDPSRTVREAGAQSLSLLDAQETLAFLPFLAGILEDESEIVRLHALEALQRAILSETEPVAELTPQLLNLLSVEQHPEALQRLVDLLVRIAETGRYQDEIPAGFRQILEEGQPDPEETTQAESTIPSIIILNGIQKLGPLALETTPALIVLLEQVNDSRYSQQIRAALKAVSGQDFGADAAQWQQWWQENLPPS